MTGIVAALKTLSLDVQTEAYPQITAGFNAAKDARRQQLEAEIRASAAGTEAYAAALKRGSSTAVVPRQGKGSCRRG